MARQDFKAGGKVEVPAKRFLVQAAWRESDAWHVAGFSDRLMTLAEAEARIVQVRAQRIYDALRLFDAHTGKPVRGTTIRGKLSRGVAA